MCTVQMLHDWLSNALLSITFAQLADLFHRSPLLRNQIGTTVCLPQSMHIQNTFILILMLVHT